jgi:hypothetical protein
MRFALSDFLASWMVSLMNFLQPLSGHVSVNLGGRNIHMAKHHLDRSKIRTPFQQMACEGVAQEVRSDPLPDASFLAIGLKILPETLAAHSPPGTVDEEKWAFFPFG